MPSRRLLLVASALLLAFPSALAAKEMAFSNEAFEKAQASGAPILVDIFATWCPTCRAQQPVLEKLEADPKYKDLKVFQIDFDRQSETVRAFGANKQSTLIVFRGDKETGRSVGVTDPAAIAALLGSAY